MHQEEVQDVQMLFQVPSVIVALTVSNQVSNRVLIHNGDQTIAIISAVNPRDIR